MVHLVIEFGYTTKRNDPMKFLLVILLFCSSSYSQSQDKIPANIQKKIDEAIDHYNLRLYDDSKKLLLELLYSEGGEKYEAEIRYHLGIASYYEDETAAAGLQFNLLRKKYPTSSRAKEISRVFSTIMREQEGDSVSVEEGFEFSQEMKYSYHFWNPKTANRKFLFGELVEPDRAVEFYEKLLKKYVDPHKRYVILLHLFYLYAGFNNNKYGFNNQSNYGQSTKGNKYAKYTNMEFKSKSIELLNQMESYVKDEFDINFFDLVESNYVFAIGLSDQKFLSEKIKTNVNSEPFFVKVVTLTENTPNNLYRTFALLWLGDKADKYIVSEELFNKWEPLGLSKKDILGLRLNKIPQEFWTQANKKNVDYTQTLPKTFLISMKLETLLKENNLVDKYKPDDLENEIANIDKGYLIYLLNDFNIADNNLIEWLLNKFEFCDDLECLSHNGTAMKNNIKFILDQKRVRSVKATQNLFMIRQSISISTLILISMNNIDIADLTQIIEENSKMLAE